MMKAKNRELDLSGRFISSGVVEGQFFAEIPVGEPIAPKRIDLICVEGDFQWPGLSKGKKLIDVPQRRVGPRNLQWVVPGVKARDTDFRTRGTVPLNKDGMRKLVKVAEDHPCWVIEVKTKLNCEAIGQVICYRHLFTLEYPQLPIKECAIVCSLGDQDLEPVCQELGILVFNEEHGFSP